VAGWAGQGGRQKTVLPLVKGFKVQSRRDRSRECAGHLALAWASKSREGRRVVGAGVCAVLGIYRSCTWAHLHTTTSRQQCSAVQVSAASFPPFCLFHSFRSILETAHWASHHWAGPKAASPIANTIVQVTRLYLLTNVSPSPKASIYDIYQDPLSTVVWALEKSAVNSCGHWRSSGFSPRNQSSWLPLKDCSFI
jgi:hypothetical protein